MGALARDSKLFGYVSDRSASADDSIDQKTTAMDRQTSVSVGHEGLLGLEETSDISTKPGGPPLSQPRVINVPAKYT